jgi:hypothetical protein
MYVASRSKSGKECDLLKDTTRAQAPTTRMNLRDVIRPLSYDEEASDLHPGFATPRNRLFDVQIRDK